MFEDVEDKLRRGNQILFSRDSRCLEGLMDRIRETDHRTLILWALDCAADTLAAFATLHAEEARPRNCLESSRAWSRGEIKMAVARRAILNCHAAARELEPVSAALCHAMGHAGATVHVETHAIGLPMYELTAIVRASGTEPFGPAILEKIRWYEARLDHWMTQDVDRIQPWAGFLLRAVPNRERTRSDKTHLIKDNQNDPGTDQGRRS